VEYFRDATKPSTQSQVTIGTAGEPKGHAQKFAGNLLAATDKVQVDKITAADGDAG
jgi:hypothetical protein